jgi:hypothetical protein
LSARRGAGSRVTAYDAQAYDAIGLLRKAIENADQKVGGATINHSLEQIKGYPASFGQKEYTLSFDADVVAVFGDVALWSSEWGQGPIYAREGGLHSDPPEHTIYRRMVTSVFTAGASRPWSLGSPRRLTGSSIHSLRMVARTCARRSRSHCRSR